MTEQQARELNDLLHEVKFSDKPFDAKYKLADWIDSYTQSEVNKISSNVVLAVSLPSDEKINLEALATEGEYRNSEWKRGYKIGFMNCAKWMKEQIEKLNKRGNVR